MKFMNWIVQNKEWIFSGIGVTVGAVIIRLLLKKNEKCNINQNIKNGNNNNQAGGDINGK